MGRTKSLLWKDFVIPSKVAEAFLTASPSAQSRLLKLPKELLLLIFSLAEPADSIFLALTCKYLLEIASHSHMQRPVVVLDRGRLLKDQEREFMLDFMDRLRPRDARGQPKRSQNLCTDGCFRYRPTERARWMDEEKTMQKLAGNWRQWWEDAVDGFQEKYPFQCPDCWYKEREVGGYPKRCR
ncbi:hypothetical protein PT974_08062 [Cladobotryum mycophilum]|uniref:F-box domain-containing protein n=1 Tax=Cladobotryum mycophilum TaxID=491253 RepID=A0ABR0SCC3_9HYPO